MIDLKELFRKIVNRKWLSAELSQDQVARIRRNTKPKRARKEVMQPKAQQHKLETKQSRHQIAYHKRKHSLHKNRSK